MCYEYWEAEVMRADKEAAKKRAQEAIDKAKTNTPEVPTEQPAIAEDAKTPVPA